MKRKINNPEPSEDEDTFNEEDIEKLIHEEEAKQESNDESDDSSDSE